MAQKNRADIRRGVHTRIRKKVSGTAERPRLAVFRSLNHIYAQVIDDVNGKTLASASTTEKDLKAATGGNIEAAAKSAKRLPNAHSRRAFRTLSSTAAVIFITDASKLFWTRRVKQD
jgi:ribosomal protein L18